MGEKRFHGQSHSRGGFNTEKYGITFALKDPCACGKFEKQENGMCSVCEARMKATADIIVFHETGGKSLLDLNGKAAEIAYQQGKSEAETAEIDEWLGEPFAVSGGEVMTRGEMMSARFPVIIEAGEELWIKHPTGNDDIPF